MSDSLGPRGLYSTQNSPGQNTGVGSLSILQGIFPTPGMEPRSPALQADSLLAESQGTPKSTGVGSLSLLQGIFLTQESNWSFLHYSQILNQLSYQGSPTTPRQLSLIVSCISSSIAKSQTWLSDFPFTFHFHALEKEMATHSSVLAWRIPGTGEPDGLPSLGSHRVRHD